MDHSKLAFSKMTMRFPFASRDDHVKRFGNPLNPFAHYLILGFIAFAILVSQASATVVYLRGDSTPLIGRIERQDNERITLKLITPRDGQNEVTILRSEIAKLLVPATEDQLSALTPSNVPAYLELAEELSVKTLDPEATELAIRLYVIAASRGDESIRNTALLGMIEVARTAEEERRFRALAFELDPLHLSDWLREPEQQVWKDSQLNEAQRDEVARLLRLVRSGRGSHARNLLLQDRVREAFDGIESEISYREFLSASQQDVLPKEFMQKVLQLEISLLSQKRDVTAGNASSKPGTQGWSESLEFSSAPIRPVTIANVTEFDPNDCIFRDGKWTNP